MESRITSNVTKLPSSCRSRMEEMERILQEEDNQFNIAHISESCCNDIKQLEQKMSKELGRQISLVAYAAD